MGRSLREALAAADADPAVRGVVLTGAGRGFCAGADMAGLNELAGGARDEGGRGTHGGDDDDPLGANYQQRYSWLLATSKPLIAAVNGPAAGVGLLLALYSDIRFAGDGARFGTAFSALGLIAEHGVSWLLPRMVGMGNALDLLYSSRLIDAEEALKMGLVQRVFPGEELVARSCEYVNDTLSRASPNAIQVTKRLVWDAQFQDLATAIGRADGAMAQRLTDPEFREGLNAFAEKRPPQWTGLSA
jgi:enoyl-CoA hydratase/carnithine racemase